MTTQTLLPEEFSDLESFAKIWSFPTETERYARRLASTMPELQEFYDAVFPRAQAAMDYLDQFPLDDLSDEQLNLLRLLYSLSSISFAVDCFKQPKIPDSGATFLDVVVEPVP
jgi:hypothetical protein